MATKPKEKEQPDSGVLLSGLLHVYGPPGSGKTLFAITASTRADKIIFLDGDSRKGKHLADGQDIKAYHDLTEIAAGMTEVDFFNYMIEFVDALPSGMDLIVWDNPFALMRGAHSLVKINRPSYRKVWAPKGVIAGGQEWQEARKILLPGLYTKLQQKAELVIFCSHEKEQSVEGVKTGLMIPEAEKELAVAAGMRIRLGRNTRDMNDPQPVGLLIKRPPAKVNINTRQIEDILPERISPCNWSTIEHYLNNPIGSRERTETETPDDFEYHLITGTLNPEQRKMFEWRRQMAILKADEDLATDVIDLAAQKVDMPPVMMHREVVAGLKERYPGITVEQVKTL